MKLLLLLAIVGALVGVGVLIAARRPAASGPVKPTIRPLAPSSAFLAPQPVAERAVAFQSHAQSDPPPVLAHPSADSATAMAAMPAEPADVTLPGLPRAVAAEAARQPQVLLDQGSTVELVGAVVIGRDPEPPATHPHAQRFLLPDATKSISKTHLLVAPAAHGVLVMDLHSTNGVSVRRPDGHETALDPGSPTVVPPGTVVTYGQRSLVTG